MPHSLPVRGTVKQLRLDGTGVIVREGVRYQFDQRALRAVTFEQLHPGSKVIFEEASGTITRPRARWVALDAGPEAA